MKIGLINTGLDENAPPINLVYLATSLKLNGFDEVKIIDETYGKKNLFKEIKGLDCVGISAMTKSYSRAIEIAKEIKSQRNLPVIVGGVHISTASHSLSKYFDLGVIGEGEKILIDLCRILDLKGSLDNHDLNNIPGLVYWDNGLPITTDPPALIKNLDDLPIPDFGLLDEQYFKKKWISWNDTTGRIMHITTSRGCPYNCIFCSAKLFWKVTRFHSAERILSEVKELVSKWDIDHIVIDDDLFLTNQQRLGRFTELMEENNLAGRVAFSCNARTNLINEEMCRLLKRMGMKSMNFGFESGNDRVLRYLKGSNVTVEDHKRAIQLCKEYGIRVYGSLIFGCPTETLEEMKETLNFIDFAIKNKCHKLFAFVMTPLPATPIWEIAKERGKVNDVMDWDILDLNNYENPMLIEPSIDLKEFKDIFKEATAKLDRAWMKDKWHKFLFFEHRRVIKKILENPIRAMVMFRNIFLRYN